MKTWYLTPKGTKRVETKITEPAYAWEHTEEVVNGRVIPYMIAYTKTEVPEVGTYLYLLSDGQLVNYTDPYGGRGRIYSSSTSQTLFAGVYGYQRLFSRKADSDVDIVVNTEVTYKETNGNDIVTERGVIKQVSEIEAIRVCIDAALQIVKGELQDKTVGVDYFGIIMSDTPMPIKVQELCRVIKTVDGVESVTYNSGSLNQRTGEMTFSFTVHTAYGDIEYEKVV